MGDIPHQERAWSVPALAEAWSCSARQVYDLIDSGRLAAFPVAPGDFRVTYRESERVRPFVHSNPDLLPVVTSGRPVIILTKRQEKQTPPPAKRTPIENVDGPKVYLVNCGPYTKIGFTKKPLKWRIDGLRTSNPYEISVWAIIHGDTNLERKLHERFASYRHGREWFMFDDAGRREVVALVKSMRGRIRRLRPWPRAVSN